MCSDIIVAGILPPAQILWVFKSYHQPSSQAAREAPAAPLLHTSRLCQHRTCNEKTQRVLLRITYSAQGVDQLGPSAKQRTITAPWNKGQPTSGGLLQPWGDLNGASLEEEARTLSSRRRCAPGQYSWNTCSALLASPAGCIRFLPCLCGAHRASDVVLCAVKQGTLYGEGTIKGNLPRSRANAVPHQWPISDVDAERIGKRLLRQVAGLA